MPVYGVTSRAIWVGLCVSIKASHADEHLSYSGASVLSSHCSPKENEVMAAADATWPIIPYQPVNGSFDQVTQASS